MNLFPQFGCLWLITQASAGQKSVCVCVLECVNVSILASECVCVCAFKRTGCIVGMRVRALRAWKRAGKDRSLIWVWARFWRGNWRVFCLHLGLLLLMLTLANNQEDPSGAKGQEGQTAGLDARAWVTCPGGSCEQQAKAGGLWSPQAKV